MCHYKYTKIVKFVKRKIKKACKFARLLTWEVSILIKNYAFSAR